MRSDARPKTGALDPALAILLRSIALLVGWWPERFVTLVGRSLGAVWWTLLRYRRDVILENLARAFPERSDAERKRLGKLACIHLVTTMLEFLRIPRYAREGYPNVRFEGLDHYEAAKAQQKGVLCLSGHFGSFELAVAAVARVASPISVVVKAFPGAVDRFINQVRSGQGLQPIAAENAVRPILAALRSNHSVVFVLDQNATRSTGVFVDFFGQPASTMSALAVLALRTEAPVIAATIVREAPGRHVLRVHPAFPTPPAATRDEAIRNLTALYTRFLEDAIRAQPEQWLWTHKRWRTRPKA